MKTSLETEMVTIISRKAARMKDLQLACMENDMDVTTGEQAYSELVCYMQGYILGRYPDMVDDMRLDNYICALAHALASDTTVYPDWD